MGGVHILRRRCRTRQCRSVLIFVYFKTFCLLLFTFVYFEWRFLSSSFQTPSRRSRCGLVCPPPPLQLPPPVLPNLLTPPNQRNNNNNSRDSSRIISPADAGPLSFSHTISISENGPLPPLTLVFLLTEFYVWIDWSTLLEWVVSNRWVTLLLIVFPLSL